MAPGEPYPRVGFIVTNMTRPAEQVVAFYNQRGTAEQHIKEGKNAITCAGLFGWPSGECRLREQRCTSIRSREP
jgi:hypothetical protein